MSELIAMVVDSTSHWRARQGQRAAVLEQPFPLSITVIGNGTPKGIPIGIGMCMLHTYINASDEIK